MQRGRVRSYRFMLNLCFLSQAWYHRLHIYVTRVILGENFSVAILKTIADIHCNFRQFAISWFTDVQLQFSRKRGRSSSAKICWALRRCFCTVNFSIPHVCINLMPIKPIKLDLYALYERYRTTARNGCLVIVAI